ncbi:MAG: RsmB/NOP family class I SAM-dependent RNA methyltransferase [Gallionella sp.]|jgi:16S rRNA (cytosine967-C5)-methyltransferase|nr:RsmB/NOP family class I SAM-dependent RNA methyltransferase [Gallionella sp.]MCK9354856.1 RsmB/NOP family class I SAM-dependent RNA methyltransferase [Gallionella sp.]
MLITEYRLDLVIQALRAILPLAHPADTTLRYFFQENRIGSNERALVAETVFGVLRHRMLLEHACTANDGQATPRRMALAHMVRFGGYNLREIEPVLKRDEKEWLATVKGVKAEDLPLSVQAELPDWLVEKMRASYSDADILAIGRAMQQGAPLDIRVNTLLAKREEVLEQLHAKKIEATITPYSPLGIRLKDKIPLNKDALFTEGKVEVQDEGSQLLGLLLAPKRNDMVVDFCAGAGGKTLMLSAQMNSQGRLYAMDVSEKRLANLKPRLKRSGASNIQPMLIAHENDLKVKRLAGKIDRVLVDAPCSGLGTLRRNPDLKFRQSPGSIEELTQKQAAILASASRLLKKGGRLVYATCSILPEENQHIVEAFLAAHPDFVLKPAGEVLQQQKIELEMGDYLELRPQLHATDGFFAAVLERV